MTRPVPAAPAALRLAALALAAVLLHASAAQADPAADLEKAKTAHTRELARLKAELLAAFDARLRENQRAGRGNDYLLPERKAFADRGVTPLLPEMQAAARAYLDGKQAADERLAAALDRAGRAEEARRVRAAWEAKPGKPAKAADVQTAADLQKYLEDTAWDWGDGDMALKWDGTVQHAGWAKAGLVTKWGAVDRRTVLLVVVKGRDKDTLAVLSFAEDLTGFKALGFGGKEFGTTRPRKR